MGCCNSVPSDEQASHTPTTTINQSETPQKQKESKRKSDKTNISPPLSHAEKSSSGSLSTWPIFVRLSSNGQDVAVQIPVHPPYLTVAGLRKELLPHLDADARVKLIYLGRLLPDQHIIVPTEQQDPNQPLPPPKNKTIQIQKEGVIQAMITTKS
ncbi:hypothetical protein EDC96DRAFT_496746 [Choanephora cucurbitarum]|nr:hypothetical protein EDC96DRAFT_496746 [Choanephora cucurbitarum]